MAGDDDGDGTVRDGVADNLGEHALPAEEYGHLPDNVTVGDHLTVGNLAECFPDTLAEFASGGCER